MKGGRTGSGCTGGGCTGGGWTRGLAMIRGHTLVVESAIGAASTLGMGSAPGVGFAEGVGSDAGAWLEESQVKGSGCPEGPHSPVGCCCSGGTEIVSSLVVGLGVSSVLFCFHWLFLDHSSKMWVSAHQTASSLHWPSNLSLHHLLAPCFHKTRNRIHMTNPMIHSSDTVQKSANLQGFCLVLPTFEWSSSPNCSSVWLRAAFYSAIPCADGLWTTCHDDLTFMVGSVRCVVVYMVQFTTLTWFQIHDFQVQLGNDLESTFTLTPALWCHHPLIDCGHLDCVDLAEQVPFLYWCWLPGITHCNLNCHFRRQQLHHRKDQCSEEPFDILWFPSTGNQMSPPPPRGDPLYI